MSKLAARQRALLSLDGLSIGDAFGETFFGPPEAISLRLKQRQLPNRVWPYTDDTEMALSLVGVLLDHGAVQQDLLAQRFAERMQPTRGYGVGAYRILSGIAQGRAWRDVSRSEFQGMGSFGNGVAMRVAPLGAFFADQPLEVVVDQARASAEVTHAHAEGIAGAVAVAVAAALAMRAHGAPAPLGRSFIEAVHDATPEGYTRDAIAEALSLPDATTPLEAAKQLGNGSAVTAADTVPFCVWVCSRFSHDFEAALWNTVSALGDRDTTCAIVGGIVACQTGRAAIPEDWFEYREAIEI